MPQKNDRAMSNLHAPGESNAPYRKLLDRLAADLIGPAPNDGPLADTPSEAFMTGILFPDSAGPIKTEEESPVDVDLIADGEEEGIVERPPHIETAARPAAAGLSFSLATERLEGEALPSEVHVTITGARYIRGQGGMMTDRDDNPLLDDKGLPRHKTVWIRHEIFASLPELDVSQSRDVSLEKLTKNKDFRGLTLTIVSSPYPEGDDAETATRLVTLVVYNQGDPTKKNDRLNMNEQCLFEFRMTIQPGECSELRGRPLRGQNSEGSDFDETASELLWRDTVEYAVGHTCAAHWETGLEGVKEITTAWLPATRVPATSTNGHDCFHDVRPHLVAKTLADPAREVETRQVLHALVNAYEIWLDETHAKIPRDVPEVLWGQAKAHLAICDRAAHRMRDGILALESDPALMRAFRLANSAMHRQQDWKPVKEGGEKRHLVWRPFQLGFFLLSAASTISPDHEDRQVMDLIWFPTGGGKTEAYLLLTAFTIFARRLQRGERGHGVCAFMRYTLRLLTLQQFERAASMICAANLIWSEEGYDIGMEPITLGLWLGRATTPNTRMDAVALLEGKTRKDVGSPVRLAKCPCCQKELKWTSVGGDVQIRCHKTGCMVGGAGPLPLFTNDEDIYDNRPSLVIGTSDKFAQIARNKRTEALFGARHDQNDPPDLIIQDELHLISGPLGTQTGLYETAIDALCTQDGHVAKVIGSTATIRRAEEQVKALFARETMQFPPSGIDAADSAFAVEDTSRLGRLYLGVSTVGHSKPEMLQAICASLLQSASVLDGVERDACWTLLGYFNSLKELGGSVTLLQAIAPETMKRFARYHNDNKVREVGNQIEVTSRIPSHEIGRVLELLLEQEGKPDAVDVALATNMISVGVDVERLGLMVVDGQPKGISEYIQATSRVGRGNTPGLVIGLYTAYRPRDRSRFETHRTWHQALYRDVEPTSVTPFAPRARDRALHAPFVAIAAHENIELWETPATASNLRPALEEIIDRIISRVNLIDPEESTATCEQLAAFLNDWTARDGLTTWWDDTGDHALLMSSEQAAQRQVARRTAKTATPTPNSMRGVEATVRIDLENPQYDR